MPRSNKQLMIVEAVSPDLVEFVLGQTNVSLLLLTPEAVAEFRGRGIPCYCPEDVVAAEAFNSLGMLNFQRAREFASIIDRHIQRKSFFVKERDLKFGFYHLDRFKILMDSIASRILILKACIHHVEPSLIGFVQGPVYPIDKTLFYKESLYGLLIGAVADYFDIPVKKYDLNADPPKERPSAELKKILRKWRAPVLSNLARIKNARYKRSPKKSRILAINPNYDLKEIIGQAEVLRNFEVWVWHGYKNVAIGTVLDAPAYVYSVNKQPQEWVSSSLPQTREVSWRWTDEDEAHLENDLRQLCNFAGLNWLPVFASRLKYFLSVMIPENIDLYIRTKHLIRNIGPQLVLYNAGVKNIQEGSVVKAVKDCSVSFCMVQHGGGGYGLLHVPNVFLRDFEGVPASSYLVWGRGVKDYFKEYAHKYDVKMLPVGSIQIRRVSEHKPKLRKRKSVPVAFYIMNNFQGNQNYFPGGQHYTDTWYFQLHLKIIEIVSRYEKWRFVFKVPPSFKQFGLYRKITKSIPQIDIRRDKLIDIIHEPSLYVVDSLSTAIIQASATAIPIIAYVGRHCKKADPHMLTALRKRALCCDTESDFLSSVETTLNNNPFKKRVALNDEFIHAYGIGDRNTKPCWEKIFNSIVVEAKE